MMEHWKAKRKENSP